MLDRSLGSQMNQPVTHSVVFFAFKFGVLTGGGRLGSVTSKTPFTACSDATGKGVKVVGVTRGLMIGWVLELLFMVVNGVKTALDDALTTTKLDTMDDDEAATDVSTLLETDKPVEFATKAADDEMASLEELVTARAIGRSENHRNLIFMFSRRTKPEHRTR